MAATLDLVYRYRQLVGKCEAGVGLDFDEIEALSRIEVLFARGDRSQDTDLWACQREFLREWVDYPGTLRTRRYQDRVRITNLGPGGLVCANAPFAEEGDTVEIIIDDEDLGLSYRFKGKVTWSRDADEDSTLGLRFIGVPVRLRYGLNRPESKSAVAFTNKPHEGDTIERVAFLPEEVAAA